VCCLYAVCVHAWKTRNRKWGGQQREGGKCDVNKSVGAILSSSRVYFLFSLFRDGWKSATRGYTSFARWPSVIRISTSTTINYPHSVRKKRCVCNYTQRLVYLSLWNFREWTMSGRFWRMFHKWRLSSDVADTKAPSLIRNWSWMTAGPVVENVPWGGWPDAYFQ
jgi:hypothetical protein